METAAIRYRVADFLKQHPPFNAMADADLVALAANGRVRFFEPNEFILWQGEPNKPHVFVIQQGTVSLWDERGGEAQLRDVRGAGDLLGAEQFNGERACLWSARSTSDVVVYGFPVFEFERAARVVSVRAPVRVGAGDRGHRFPARRRTLGSGTDVPARRSPGRCAASPSERDRRGGGADARPRRRGLAVTTADSQLLGVVDTGTLLDVDGRRQRDPQAPVASIAARDAADRRSRRVDRGRRAGDGRQRRRRARDDG